MEVTNPGSAGVTSVTGTAPITSSGGATPAIGLTAVGYWQSPGTSASSVALTLGGANQTYVSGCPIGYPVRAGHLTFFVSTADNSANVYDLGFYNSAGTLVANLGAASYTTTGYKTVAFAQGTVQFNAGIYYLAYTGNANVLGILATISNATLLATFGFNNNVVASVGGALPASITAPSPAAPTISGSQPWFCLTP